MNFTQVFDIIFQRNPVFGRLLISVLGLFAVIALVSLWKIDIVTSIIPILILVVVSVAVVVITHLTRDRIMARVISWFFIIFLMVYSSAIMASALFPHMLPAPPHCIAVFFQKCADLEVWIFARNQITPQATTTIAPPVSPIVPTAKATDPCVGVDISLSTGSAPWAAQWCGSPGATRTTLMQAFFDRTPSCKSYATKSFAALSQNQLYRRAVQLTKAGEFDDAFELIDACQCHSPAMQALIREGKQRMLCWLRAQS